MQTDSISQNADIQHGRRVSGWLELFVLAVILAVFLALTMHQINKPGLHPDEAQEVVPTVQLLRRQNVDTLRDSGLDVLGRRLPLMIVDYIGTVNTYLAVPFFGIFGISTFSLRLMSVLTSAVALVLLWMLGRELYSSRVGLTAAALLAVHPSFVFWSRQGVFVTFVTAPLILGATLLGVRWWRGTAKRPQLALYGSIFLVGLALAAKLLTIWAVVGIGGAFVVLYAQSVVRALRERTLAPLGIALNRRQVGLVIVSFLLGTLMLIIYNIQSAGTWLVLKDNLRTSYYGTNNLSIFSNLVERFKGLGIVLTGRQFWYLGGEFANRWWLLALPVGGLIALAVVLWRGRTDWRKILFPYLTLGIMLSASIFTVSSLLLTHLALLTPWVALSMAVALALFAQHFRPRWLGIGLATLVGVGLIGTDLQVDRNYHRELSVTGGYGAHNSTIYDLVDRLEAEDDRRPYVVDWGIQDSVQFLSESRINPVELTGFEFDAGQAFAQRVIDSLQDADHIYIFHSSVETVFQRREIFDEVIAEQGYEFTFVEDLYDVTGRPIFTLIRLGPADVS